MLRPSRPGPVAPGRGQERSSPPTSKIGLATLVLVVVVLALGVTRLAGVLPSLGNPFTRETVDRSQPALLQAIEDLGEYHAASGQFQVIIDTEEDTRFLPSFLSGERTVFLAGGSVDSFVDFTGLGDGAITVSDDRSSVTVRLPAPRLSEPRIDPERSYVVSRDRGLLDRAGAMFSDGGGERDLYLLAEEKLAAAAAEADLEQRAEGNTRAMLESMLTSLGFSDVRVIFDDGAVA